MFMDKNLIRHQSEGGLIQNIEESFVFTLWRKIEKIGKSTENGWRLFSSFAIRR